MLTVITRIAQPGYPLTYLVNSLAFVLTVGVIEVVGAALRHQDLKQIETQAGRLAEKEARLQTAVESARMANTQIEQWVKELENRGRELSLMSQMGELLQTCQTVEEAHTIIGGFTSRLFPGTTGALYLINASRTFAEAVLSWGSSVGTMEQPLFALTDCLALRRGKIHHYSQAAGQDRSFPVGSLAGIACPHVHGNQAESICVPMMAQGEALGVLHLEIENHAALITGDQRRVVQAVTEQLALSLANLRLRDSMRQQSIREVLTGLFNRRYLEVTMERELRRVERTQQPLGVIMLDIDFFKRFNDTYGHAAGDVLLQEVGRWLASRVRGADVACRYGGEEFVLILPEASLDSCLLHAEELRQEAAALKVDFRGTSIGPISISLGVAVFPEHGIDSQGLLKLADNAMYRAKKAGRNQVQSASA